MDYSQQALDKHKQLKGKIQIALKDTLDETGKLSVYYTPGVGAVSSYVAKHPNEARDYTWLNNAVAVISDGSAVLGLGNLGPYGALPVMEGKCMLFKHFANIDAVPVVLDVHSADEIVAAVKAIAPSYGGINLEDIAAPICFEVEERLKAELSIPIMHDDQHATAIVVLAGLLNACKVTGRDLRSARIVIVGAGAAGVAVAKLLDEYGTRLSGNSNGTDSGGGKGSGSGGPIMFAVDSKGLIHHGRTDLNPAKQRLLRYTNLSQRTGTTEELFQGADIVIGVSGPEAITPAMIRAMAKDPIVFALANPTPEIMPDEAKAAGAAVVATGRSDFPNQVNNALAFPGIFRGALDNHVSAITDDHKLAAAHVLAELVEHPTPTKIIPSPFTAGLVEKIAAVIR